MSAVGEGATSEFHEIANSGKALVYEFSKVTGKELTRVRLGDFG
jgi:hypothetical protein